MSQAVQNHTTEDPFASHDAAPSISFKDAPDGTTVVGTVLDDPHLVQGRDWQTNKPAVWDDGNPKMVVVVRLKVNGTDWNLWASKPSALYAAIADAQRAAGARITVGGTLSVQYTGMTTMTSGKTARQYLARYSPPAPADPWAEATPAGNGHSAVPAATAPAWAATAPAAPSAQPGLFTPPAPPSQPAPAQPFAAPATPVAPPAPAQPFPPTPPATPAAPAAALPTAPADPAAALALVRTLIAGGMADGAIHGLIPTFGMEAIAAVRGLPA